MNLKLIMNTNRANYLAYGLSSVEFRVRVIEWAE